MTVNGVPVTANRLGALCVIYDYTTICGSLTARTSLVYYVWEDFPKKKRKKCEAIVCVSML